MGLDPVGIPYSTRIRTGELGPMDELPFSPRRFDLPEEPLDPNNEYVIKDCEYIIDNFNGNIYSFYNNENITENTRRHIDLFLTKLFLWEKIPIEKGIDSEEIFLRSIIDKHIFTDELKDLRFYSMKDKISRIPAPDDEPVVETWGYDSLFREQDLIFWKHDDINDLEWGFTEPFHSDEFYENVLIPEIRDILTSVKDRVRPVTENEVLSNINNSSSLDEGTTVFQHLNYFPEKLDEGAFGLYGRRTKINVRPGSDRDTVVPSIPTLKKIKHDSMLLSRFLEHLPESGMCSYNKLKKRMRFLGKNSYFLMLDIKKCGLTFPIKFIIAVGMILEELGFSNYYNHHEKTVVIDEGTPLQLISGYCLGWANEIPTLAYIANKRISIRNLQIPTQSLFFNDDSVFMPADKSPISCYKIKDEMYTNLTLSGILMNTKKPIISHGNVFCEIYSRTEAEGFDSRKRQALTSAVSRSICSISVTISREAMLSVGEYYDDSCDEIIQIAQSMTNISWSGLYNLPYIVGGFTNYEENNLNAGLRYLEEWGTCKEITMSLEFLSKSKKMLKPAIFDLRRPDQRVKHKRVIKKKLFDERKLENPIRIFQSEEILNKVDNLINEGLRGSDSSESLAFLTYEIMFKNDRSQEIFDSYVKKVSEGMTPSEALRTGVG